MLFWIVAIAAAVISALLIARPLLIGRSDAAPRAAHDLQVFKDQLKALDAEIARGVISEEEAEGSRLEISRRLLAADAEARAEEGAHAAPAGLSRGLAAALIVAAPLASAWLYLDHGAPGTGDMPLASRGETGRPSQEDAEKMMAGREQPAPSGADAEEFKRLVEQLEGQLESDPDNPQGRFLYARSLMNLGRFAEAWPQFEKVIELRGGDAELYAGLSEGQILAAGGYISPEAEANLLQVLRYQPTNPSARYYLGILHVQDGEPDWARSVWEELLRESPPDAPWVPPIRAQLAEIGGAPPLRGPTAAEMQAAGDLPPAQRNQMVQNMVNSLSDRLTSEGGTVEEWMQLIRSYNVLGQPRQAREAMAAAQEAFAGDPAALARLEGGGAPVPGLPGSGAPAPGGELRGPSQEDVAAAAEMDPDDRAAMITGMVGRLKERLETEGGSVEEWMRLISSLGVIGDSAGAAAAYEQARAALAGDPRALSTLEAAFEGAPRAAAPDRGPTQEQVAAAADMAPDDRQEMIRGMVSRLHERLRENGRVEDVNEWGKLFRSYKVLGDTAAIEAAYREAIEIYSDDAIGLAYLKEAALLSGAELN